MDLYTNVFRLASSTKLHKRPAVACKPQFEGNSFHILLPGGKKDTCWTIDSADDLSTTCVFTFFFLRFSANAMHSVNVAKKSQSKNCEIASK